MTFERGQMFEIKKWTDTDAAWLFIVRVYPFDWTISRGSKAKVAVRGQLPLLASALGGEVISRACSEGRKISARAEVQS